MGDKYEEGKYQFKSLEEAGNYVQDLKDKVKRRAGHEDFPVTTALPEERRRFLLYCVRILEEEKGDLKMIRLLQCRIMGYSTPQLAQYLGDSIENVNKVEREAIARVKDAIERRKAKGIPIIGG